MLLKKNKTISIGPKQSKFFIGLIVIFSILLYANSLTNGYVLDDEGLLINNSLTEKGLSAISEIVGTGYRSTLTFIDNELYRPVPKLFFAFFWSVSPANPFIPHLFNVLVYSAINILLFLVFRRVLRLSLKLSVITILLFIFHPIHTEVVANSKSLDELLCLFFLLLGSLVLNNLWNKRWFSKEFWLSFFFLLLAFLSKESAIAFMLCIPLAFYVFQGKKLRMLIPVFAVITLSSLIYFLMRIIAINPDKQTIEKGVNFLASIPNLSTKTGYALYILTIYCKQLLLPFELLSDASFNYFSQPSLMDWRLLPSLAIVGLLIATYFKRSPNFKTYVFGFLFFILTILPVSNLLILIGTNYGERFLLVPSIGICLILATIIDEFIKSDQKFSFRFLNMVDLNRNQIIFLAILLSFFAVSTINRNRDWYSNQTLFAADIIKAPESARLQAYYASSISNSFYLSKFQDSQSRRAKIMEAIVAYEKAISINPEFHQAYISLAQLYIVIEKIDIADSLFKTAIRLKPDNPYHLNNYGNFLFTQKRFSEAEQYFRGALVIEPDFAEALNNTGSILANQAKIILEKSSQSINAPYQITNPLVNEKLDSALLYFSHAKRLDQTFPDPWYYSHLIYKWKGDDLNSELNRKSFEKLISNKNKKMRMIQKFTNNS